MDIDIMVLSRYTDPLSERVMSTLRSNIKK
jgi:hypothetical protein